MSFGEKFGKLALITSILTNGVAADKLLLQSTPFDEINASVKSKVLSTEQMQTKSISDINQITQNTKNNAALRLILTGEEITVIDAVDKKNLLRIGIIE